ncbi:MAG: DUF1579 family protein [Rhizobiales bacterium]|nr:DUF1579 domain-containing protein [Hyphomicrobiales bacterium]NRB13606.1 DUF1579 family protein [Hyphomicrobiales bacterium]
MRRIMLKTILFTCLLTAVASPAVAAEKAMSAEVEKLLNYARVTKHHEVLAKLKGDWRGRGSLVNTEGGAAEKILCKASYKLILGGRFVEQQTVCKGAGFSFDGVGHFGYDALSRTYVGTSMTTADSGISTLNGVMSGKVITFNISHNNINLKKRVISRATLTIEDNGAHKYEISAADKSGVMKPIFSVTYTK